MGVLRGLFFRRDELWNAFPTWLDALTAATMRLFDPLAAPAAIVASQAHPDRDSRGFAGQFFLQPALAIVSAFQGRRPAGSTGGRASGQADGRGAVPPPHPSKGRPIPAVGEKGNEGDPSGFRGAEPSMGSRDLSLAGTCNGAGTNGNSAGRSGSHPLPPLLVLLEAWQAEHRGGRKLAAQCLAHFAVRMALRSGLPLPESRGIPGIFHLAVVAAALDVFRRREDRLPEAWLEAWRDRVACGEPDELAWLLWVTPATFPAGLEAVRKRAEELAGPVDGRSVDYAASRREILRALVGSSSWNTCLPPAERRTLRRAARNQRAGLRRQPLLSRSWIQTLGPWLLLARAPRPGKGDAVVRRLLERTRGRSSVSTFAVFYAVLLLLPRHPDRDRAWRLTGGGLGHPRWWASSLERRLFATVRLAEAALAGDRTHLRRLLLGRIDDLPNLFLAADLAFPSDRG